jgi:hypothetical protein
MFRIRPILQQNVKRVFNNNIIKRRYLSDKSEKKLDFLKVTKFYMIGTGIYGFGSGVYIFSTQFTEQAKEKPFESIFVSFCLGLLCGVGWPGQILLKTVQGMDYIYQKTLLTDKKKDEDKK